MQLSTILLSGLLATQVVNAKSQKSASSSKAGKPQQSSTVKSVHSSSSSSSSVAASTTAHNVTSSYVAGSPWSTLAPTETYQCGFTNFNSSFGIAVKTLSLNLSSITNVTSTSSSFSAKKTSGASSVSASSSQNTTSLIAPTAAVDVVKDGQVRALVTITNTDETMTTTTLTRTKTIVLSTTTLAALNASLVSNVTALNETYGLNLSNISIANITSLFGNISNASLFNATVLNYTAAYMNSSHYANTTSYNSTVQCSAQLPSFFNDLSCKSNSTLAVTLHDSVLRDSLDRIGSITSSHQFQFTGPFPQSGSIFAKGWSITPDGYLALGGTDIFYECLSGDSFYNLYDEFIGSQCTPIQLEVVTLIDC